MGKTALILLALSLAIAACEPRATEPADPSAATDVVLYAPGGNPAGLVRTTWPSPDDPGPPFYARIEPTPPHILVVDGWAVIPFYRDPSCIPAGFNLLTFFDPPAAFGCPLAVSGFSLWEEVFAGPPKITQTRGGGAVPFWFIPADAALNAVQDGVLTIGELAALPGLLTGQATFFQEMLHPLPGPGGEGGHPNPKLVLNARGTLEDGRGFQFHFTQAGELGPGEESIRLRFR